MSEPGFRSLPDAEHFCVSTSDGVVLPVYAVGGPSDAPGLLVAHANGMAAGSYGPWLAELARDLRVFAFDARGHGGSSWPIGPLDQVFHVDRFAEDLALAAEAVAARLGGAALHFAGHSLGAAAALRLGLGGRALPWSRSILFEPPIFPPPTSAHYAEASAKQTPLINLSAARRAQWASPEALCAALSTRGVFARFRRDLLEAHCRATLKPCAEGGYTLACPPAVESAIFRSHRVADTWERLPSFAGAVHLVGGDAALPERGWVGVVLHDMAALIPGARLTTLPGADHMMIFEQPEKCRRLVLREIVRQSTRYA